MGELGSCVRGESSEIEPYLIFLVEVNLDLFRILGDLPDFELSPRLWAALLTEWIVRHRWSKFRIASFKTLLL